MLYRVSGKKFPPIDIEKDGKAERVLDTRKTHLVGGSKESWIWPGTTEDLRAAEVIVKCEGLPDAMALRSAGQPAGWLPITNACGAKSAKSSKLSFGFAA